MGLALYRNNKGFSIMEALIVMGLMAISAMAALHLFKFQVDGNTFTQAQASANQKAWEVTQILRDKTACDLNMASLARRTINMSDPNAKLDFTEIVRRPGDPVARVGQTTPEGILIEGLEIGNLNALATAGVYSAKVVMNMRINKSGYVKSFSREIDVVVNGTGTEITTCQSASGDKITDALGMPDWPQYVLCTDGTENYVFHVGACTVPTRCSYRLLHKTTRNIHATYTRSGTNAIKTSQRRAGRHCMTSFPLDGSISHGPGFVDPSIPVPEDDGDDGDAPD